MIAINHLSSSHIPVLYHFSPVKFRLHCCAQAVLLRKSHSASRRADESELDSLSILLVLNRSSISLMPSFVLSYSRSAALSEPTPFLISFHTAGFRLKISVNCSMAYEYSPA